MSSGSNIQQSSEGDSMKKYASSVSCRACRIFVVLLALVAAPFAVAADASWHHESASYHVYLGIVPANLIRSNPVLVDGDKTLHQDNGASGASQHVLVSIFRKPGNERVTNATVIARVGPRKLLGGSGTEKPLEKMLTSGVITYGNYFSMPKKADYEIEVRVYEPHKEKAERIAPFVYKRL